MSTVKSRSGEIKGAQPEAETKIKDVGPSPFAPPPIEWRPKQTERTSTGLLPSKEWRPKIQARTSANTVATGLDPVPWVDKTKKIEIEEETEFTHEDLEDSEGSVIKEYSV